METWYRVGTGHTDEDGVEYHPVDQMVDNVKTDTVIGMSTRERAVELSIALNKSRPHDDILVVLLADI